MPNQYSWYRESKYVWDILYLKCTKCWKWGTVCDFHKSKRCLFWVKPDCKECRKKYSRDYRNSHKEIVRGYNNRYRSRNKEAISLYSKEHTSSLTNKLWFNWNTFHNKAKNYAKRHDLRPSRCPLCWAETQVEMHHPFYDNYDMRSLVVFCCSRCHKNIHTWNIKCPPPINLLELEVA